jgi:hypothetical protein
MSENQFGTTAEQAVAVQKLWMDSISKILQAAFTATPNSPPPEVVGQIRAGILQALAHSWEEYMRSPQFLAGMRQWMENAVAFRKLTNDFMASVRSGLQAPSRGDIDTVMLTVRHMEKRLLDRLEDSSAKVNSLDARLGRGTRARQEPGARVAPSPGRPRAGKPRGTRPKPTKEQL